MERRRDRLIRVIVLATVLAGCTVSSAGSSSTPGTEIATPRTDASPGGAPGAQETNVSASPYTPVDFWAGVAPGGFNDEHYDSLDQMTKAADLVMVGTVTQIRQDPSRHTGLSPSDGAFAQLDFNVEEVLSGAPQVSSSGAIIVELFMTDPGQYDRFSAGLPTERVLIFLRNKAVEAKQNGWPDEGPDTGHLYYRVVSDQGIVRDVDGLAVAPDDEGGFLSDINLKTFDEVVAAIRGAGS